jgi:hypothetical protein
LPLTPSAARLAALTCQAASVIGARRRATGTPAACELGDQDGAATTRALLRAAASSERTRSLLDAVDQTLNRTNPMKANARRQELRNLASVLDLGVINRSSCVRRACRRGLRRRRPFIDQCAVSLLVPAPTNWRPCGPAGRKITDAAPSALLVLLFWIWLAKASPSSPVELDRRSCRRSARLQPSSSSTSFACCCCLAHCHVVGLSCPASR